MRLLIMLTMFAFMGCTTIYTNQKVVSKAFPKVSGKNLEEKPITMPKFFAGKHTVLLIGYKQNSQFDIDRWILGLSDSGVKAKIYELPTVVGMVPRMISGKIDSGMRSGIPQELWIDVITLYGDDADKVAKFTGNERPLNARVMLLDPKGEILFFHDRGYGVSYLRELTALLPKELK